jgi:hypothetical protein
MVGLWGRRVAARQHTPRQRKKMTAHTEAEEEDETITRGEYLVGGRR